MGQIIIILSLSILGFSAIADSQNTKKFQFECEGPAMVEQNSQTGVTTFACANSTSQAKAETCIVSRVGSRHGISRYGIFRNGTRIWTGSMAKTDDVRLAEAVEECQEVFVPGNACSKCEVKYLKRPLK